MIAKVSLLGVMGYGKSSVGNLLLGKEIFKVSNGIEHCTLGIQSELNDNGDFQVFDTKGLGDKEVVDTESLQEMILFLKREKINAIFLVLNGQVCRISEQIKKIIRSICKLFMGKYIWKQIGLIFTHYGFSEEEQLDVKEREQDYIKDILKTAEEQYKEIIKNQDQNNKTCDPNEEIVNTLKCFYVNSKKKRNGQYDADTIKECKNIKEWAKKHPPINLVQSKFIVKKEIIKDQKGDISNIIKKEKEKGVLAGLKTAGCYAFGIGNIIDIPLYLGIAGACKLIGLPFNDNSFVNKMGDASIECIKHIPTFFTDLPEKVKSDVITSSETHYDIYDLEIIYYSNKEIENRIINIRHKVIKNN